MHPDLLVCPTVPGADAGRQARPHAEAQWEEQGSLGGASWGGGATRTPRESILDRGENPFKGPGEGGWRDWAGWAGGEGWSEARDWPRVCAGPWAAVSLGDSQSIQRLHGRFGGWGGC